MKEVVVFAPLWSKLPISGYGAIEVLTLERVKYLRLAGYKVQLVAETDDYSLADEVLVPGNMYRFPDSRFKGALSIMSLKWTKYLSQFIRLSNSIWDAPILSDASSMDPFNNYFLAHNFGEMRLLFFLHGNYYFSNGIGNIIYYPIDKITGISRKINYGALNSQLRTVMVERGMKCFYTPNGIEFPPISEVETSPEDYLLFVGKLTRDKAPHLAIKIARSLKMPLKIAGPIGERKYFETFVKPNIGGEIEYLGHIHRNVLNEAFKKASALIVTSDWNDPQPTVILEAMRYGVPVLALNLAKYSGIYDMIENGITGYIGNEEDILRRAKGALEINRTTIYNYAKSKWSWEKVLEKYHLPVIRELAQR
jgi:glycosyltransferase involved in cell wall biosynthesis